MAQPGIYKLLSAGIRPFSPSLTDSIGGAHFARARLKDEALLNPPQTGLRSACSGPATLRQYPFRTPDLRWFMLAAGGQHQSNASAPLSDESFGACHSPKPSNRDAVRSNAHVDSVGTPVAPPKLTPTDPERFSMSPSRLK